MNTARILSSVAAILALASWAQPARATFHFMQIEQIIGGVNGDATAQAIQLRMRSAGQNLLNGQAVLRVRDATGANPILITNFPAPNPASASCGRILIASANFANVTSPAVDSMTRDYLMTNLIPPGYLAAGSLTFEDTFGTVLWRVSWGGGSYTGSNSGSLDNDSDGNFGPPVSVALPSGSKQALAYTPACPPATSTNNAAQYSVTAGAAVFTNNDGTTFTVVDPPPVPAASTWGIACLLLTVLAAGTTVLRFDARPAA